jgi:hypothetical protein
VRTDTHDNGASDNRRSDARYRIAQEVRHFVPGVGELLFERSGKTIDISSGGVLFDASIGIPAGMDIELRIPWPSRFQNEMGSEMIAIGQTRRMQGELVALKIIQYG